MTERTRLISYLLYGHFSAILNRNTIKTPEVIFHIRLCALQLSSQLLILKKYLYASFSFSYWKYSCILSIFSVVFAHVVLLTTQNSHRAEKKFHNARSLQENKCPLSSQSERAYYCSHIIKSLVNRWMYIVMGFLSVRCAYGICQILNSGGSNKPCGKEWRVSRAYKTMYTEGAWGETNYGRDH